MNPEDRLNIREAAATVFPGATNNRECETLCNAWANLEFLGCEIKFDFVEKYVGGLVPAGHSVNWLIKAFLYDSAI